MSDEIRTSRDIYLEINRQRVISYKDDIPSTKRWVSCESEIAFLKNIKTLCFADNKTLNRDLTQFYEIQFLISERIKELEGKQ
jgi:hypothetical protein